MHILKFGHQVSIFLSEAKTFLYQLQTNLSDENIVQKLRSEETIESQQKIHCRRTFPSWREQCLKQICSIVEKGIRGEIMVQ